MQCQQLELLYSRQGYKKALTPQQQLYLNKRLNQVDMKWMLSSFLPYCNVYLSEIAFEYD